MLLRIGVVGVGPQWYDHHRPALRSLSDRFEIRAVTSPVSLLAEQAAQDFRCDTVDGFHRLASRDDIDALMVLNWEWYGDLPIHVACRYEKAVYASTTLEMTLSEATRAKTAVDTSGITFMAELPQRHAPATIRLKELIATRLGKPQMIFCHRRASVGSTRSESDFRRDGHDDPKTRVTRTRALLEQLDWCSYVMDDALTGARSIQHQGPDGIDYQLISLQFQGLGLAQVSFGSYLQPHWPEAASFRPPADLQVCCENGVAFVDLPSRVIWFDEAGRHHESLEHERPVGEQLLKLFHRSVTSLVRRNSGLDDVCRAIEILESA